MQFFEISFALHVRVCKSSAKHSCNRFQSLHKIQCPVRFWVIGYLRSISQVGRGPNYCGRIFSEVSFWLWEGGGFWVRKISQFEWIFVKFWYVGFVKQNSNCFPTNSKVHIVMILRRCFTHLIEQSLICCLLAQHASFIDFIKYYINYLLELDYVVTLKLCLQEIYCRVRIFG